MGQHLLDARLAERLREIYGLAQTPATLAEFGKALVRRTTTHSRLREFIELIRAGNAAIGECGEKHGYSLTFPNGRKVEVMCAYDALMTSVLQGRGQVYATCPHCAEKMKVQIDRAQLSQASSSSIVFWLGAGPKDAPGNPICDHLHLFPDMEHLAVWLRAQRDELGVSLPLKEAIEFLRQSESD